MKLLILLLVVMLLAASGPMVFAAPSSGPLIGFEVPKGYKMGVLGVTGSIAGYDVNHNGTIQEIFAQLELEHPDFAKATALASSTTGTSTSLAARYNGAPSDGKDGAQCNCNSENDWRYADVDRIEDGIDYLNKVTGSCNMGGRTCVRISCSYNAAIHMCNDRNEHVYAPCNWISTFAQDISDNCRKNYGAGTFYRACGQEFTHTRDYNVIVNFDPC